MVAVSRWLLILIVLLAGIPAVAAKKPISVHDVYAHGIEDRAPNAIWRPDGAAFAYIENGRLWLYDVASHHAREWARIDDFARDGAELSHSGAAFTWQNRRVDRSGPQWFPNNRLLLPTNAGLFILMPGDSRPLEHVQEIKQDDAPELSPDGTRILFRKKGNLYAFDLATRKTIQLTSDATETTRNGELDWVYPEELDLGKAFWWSPDSRKIAYLQFDVKEELLYPHADLLSLRAIFEPQRYPQAGTPNARVKVGVVAADGGNTKWMDSGGDGEALIARVNWMPDSSSLAIQRLTRVQDRLDLLMATVADGSSKTVLTESDKTWVNVQDDLHFLRRAPEFLWSSERTGFRHLYLYSDTGKLLKQLTSGEWQVSRLVAVDERRRRAVFTASEATPLEDQLYSVPLDGSAPSRLSNGSGMHAIQAPEDGACYLDTFSNLTSPPETTLHDANGNQLAVVREPDRKVQHEFDILPTEIVATRTADGTLLYARLIRPAHFDASQKYPAIVFVYGGPHVQSVRNLWTGVTWEQALAHQGFVIWQLDNRGTFGRGHAFESPVYREFGKVELADQRAGVEKLLSMGFVDKNRIGVYGWSFGGYLTLYCLLHAPDVFKVGIAGAPVTDWHNYDTIYTERYMGVPSANARGYEKSSNVLAAGQLQGRLLIVCNFEDDNVLFQNTMQIMTALHNADKEFDFMLYPQKTHNVRGPVVEGMHQQMTDFFIRNLRPGTASK